MARTDHPTIQHRLEALAHLLLGWLVTRLPYGFAVRTGAFVGIIAGFCGIRGKVVRENIATAFGDRLTPAEQRRLASRAYQSLCMLAIESFYLERRDTRWVRGHVTVEGMENLEQARASGRRFLAITGHLGNWEIMGAWAGEVHPTTTRAKTLHNPLVQKRVARARARHGIEVIWADHPQAMKLIIRALHSDRCLNLLADQDAGVEGIFVPFFGKPASTTPTPALLSIRHDMPILPSYIVRLSPTRHRVHICPMLDPAGLPPGTREEQVLELTARHVAVLEGFVRRHPDQYFWFHRRWKTTPEYAKAKLEKRRRKRGAKIRALESLSGEMSRCQRQP